MNSVRGVPTLAQAVPHDWARHYFRAVPDSPAWQEHVAAPYLHLGTSLEYVSRSREGLSGALVAARNERAAPSERRMVFWHGRTRLVEEAFHGWFGARLQRLRNDAVRLLLGRLDHFTIANAATDPTFVIPLPSFARLGVSHGVLEAVVGAPCIIAAECLYAEAAYVSSLRVYVDYDGTRRGAGTRKLFYNATGAPVPVEWVARDLLRRLGYDVVSPSLFARLFFALVGRPPSHFGADVWPTAFLRGRIGPLEWAARAQARLAHARAVGVRGALDESLEELAKRPPYRDVPRPAGALPLIGHLPSRSRFASLFDALGDRRLVGLLEGFLWGYRAAAADWFAWQPDGGRAHFCEVKSRGDTLRPYQKEAILWSQRSGLLDYRLLEVLHGATPSGAQAF